MTEPGPIAQRISVALEAVEEAQVPSDLRAIAFAHALESAANPSQPTVGAARPDGPEDGAGMLDAISQRVGVDQHVVSGLFEERDGEVHLTIGRAQLPNGASKAASMRDVALLVAAGRQAAGLEDYTPTALIRRECDELGVLDSSNFSVEVSRLGLRTRGGSKSKEVHANRHQMEVAGELMTRIVGGEEQ
ncbi:MAG TPA: hypothetical protein VFL77_08910 [Solirubrobacterales bacterium]|nr:hypothetical protein [Solirubrobacterales bacterium]